MNIKNIKKLFAVLLIATIAVSPLAGYEVPVMAEETEAVTGDETIADEAATEEEQAADDVSEDDLETSGEDAIDTKDQTGDKSADDSDPDDLKQENEKTGDAAQVDGSEDMPEEGEAEEDSLLEENSESKTTMVIKDGMAQPIFDYTKNCIYTDDDSPNRDNAGKYRDILRFCVYVETDLDTDLDGMNDLVMANVQVPLAAVKGDYKAPTIFHASPYMGGCSDTQSNNRFTIDTDPGDVKEEKYYKPGHERTPSQTDPVSSYVAADATKQTEWYYRYDELQYDKELKDMYYLSGLHDQDYFLVRGFAVVNSAGLGTNGSEGLEACGSIAERDAFKNIVEWIHGDRVAYTNKTDNIPIKADWANGNVGMEGLSYDGTMAYEVATTGVDGLKTVVPEGAISSWYDYSNTQGESHRYDGSDEALFDYTTYLGSSCASRFFGKDSTADNKLLKNYNKLLGYMRSEQKKLKGNYGDYWNARDHYTQTMENKAIKASALIVHGLNDLNVNAKQADLMRKAFLASGCDVRLLLHQGAHETPDNMVIWKDSDRNYYYDDLLNIWFTHFLWGTDDSYLNDIPNIWAQFNTDGGFVGMNDEKDENGQPKYKSVMKPNDTKEHFISAIPDTGNGGNSAPSSLPRRIENEPDPNKDAYYSIDDFHASIPDYHEPEDDEDSLLAESEGGPVYEEIWRRNINKDLTINGVCEAKLNIAAESFKNKKVTLAAVMLYDETDAAFPAFAPKKDGSMERVTVSSKTIDRGGNLEKTDEQKFKQTNVKKRLITKGVINLRNPNAKYEPATSKAPEDAAVAETYYDYSIYMIPTVYTVKAGHRLVLYIMPSYNGIYSQTGFWIDNGFSSLTIPLYPPQNGGDPDLPVVEAPVASIPSGSVPGGTKVRLSSATQGAEIYYTFTTDGSEPENPDVDYNGDPKGSTQKYEDAFIIDGPIKIKAFATLIDGLKDDPVEIKSFEYNVSYDWKDIDDDKKALFDDDPSKVPEGMWYFFDGVSDVYERSQVIGLITPHTGSAVIFDDRIHVFYGNSRLWQNRDYTVTYSNNVNAADIASKKAPTVTISGKGNFSSKASFKFEIDQADINNADITSEKAVALNVGSKISSVKPSVGFNGKKLTLNRDYLLEYYLGEEKIADSTKCEAGKTYTVSVVAKEGGNFSGRMTQTVAVHAIDPKDKTVIQMKNVTVKLPKIKYSGSDINVRQLFVDGSYEGYEVSVKNGRTTLECGTDYEVDDVNYKDAGKYSVTIRGIDGKSVGNRTVTLEIVGIPASKVKIACLNTSCAYSGEKITLADLYKPDKTKSEFNKVTLYTVKGKTNVPLDENTDYDCAISNTGALGKFDLVFTLKGGYTGTIKKTITVGTYNIATDVRNKITVTCADAAFSKGGAIPAVTVKYGDKVLEEGVDYKLSFGNNVKIASATDKSAPTVTVTGIGNFAGTKKQTFNITNGSTSNITLYIPDKEYRAAKGNFKTTPKLMEGGKPLTVGKGKDVEPLPAGSYKYYYAGSGLEIPDNAMVGCNVFIEVRVTITCSDKSPYGKGSHDLRGYYRLVDKSKNIAHATAKLKNTAKIPFSYGQEIIPLKNDNISLVMNKQELLPSDYEIVSITNNRFIGLASVQLRGKGEYGGEKKFTFSIISILFN